MSETRLGINITARDSAGPTIQQLTANLRSLEAQQRSFAAAAAAGGVGAQNAAKAIAAEVTAVREQISAMTEATGVTHAAAAANQNYTRSALGAASANRILYNETRHAYAIMDSFVAGRHGQMMASIGAATRDAGFGVKALAVGLGAMVAVMGATAMIRGAERMGKFAENVKAGAMATGMSIEQFSQLQGAMRLVGSSAESADAGLRHFSNAIGKAIADPASKSAQVLHDLGISQNQLKTSDPGALLDKVADGFRRYGEGATKAEAQTVLFGQGSQHMATLLEGGGSSIEKLKQRAQELGITLTSDTQKALADTGQKAYDLAAAISGRAIQAFVQWKPVIDVVIGSLTWLVEKLFAVVGAIHSAAMAIHGFFQSVEGFLGFKTGGGGIDLPDVDVSGARPQFPGFGSPRHKGGGAGQGPAKAATAEYRSALADLHGQLEILNRDEQLNNQLASEKFALSKTLDYGEGATGHFARAQAEYAAYKSSQEQKLKALESFRAQSDNIHKQITAETLKEYAVGGEKYKAASPAEKAAPIWGEEAAAYKKAKADEEAADKEFEIKNLQIANNIKSHLQEVINAHTAAVQEATKAWASAFDNIGSSIEGTIGAAIKSAFQPMKPEYWYSAVQGPHGQPLTQAHRINPTAQLFDQLGFNILGDLGKSLQSTLMTSLSKSLFPGSASFGEGIAKTIGLGTPGGLFGSGLGAVAETATFQGSVDTFAAAVATFAGAAGVGAGGSALGAAGGLAGVGGSLLKWGGGIPFIFAAGGIVPSAAGGWALGSQGSLAQLHAREMVLPAHISQGLQDMISSGGGGNHLHFHGPADAPSIDKWFRNMMQGNPKVIRNMFHYNALTPRSI